MTPCRQWLVSTFLLVATAFTTTYAGALHATAPGEPVVLARGLAFGIPLMAILVAHELGHYLVGRLHGVPTSPPYFLPMPPQYFLIGTMGAIITVPGPIRSRNVMIDFAMGGPLAGLIVTLPILAYGIATSEIAPAVTPALIEGRSLLYLGLVHALQGPIPAGMDIHLSPTAFAGWVGLLVTMINLIPCGQLDGGHVAEAALGPRYRRFSRHVMALLLALGVVVGAAGVWHLHARGAALATALGGASEGVPWIVWCGLQWLIERGTRGRAPEPTASAEALTPARRALVATAAVLFVLLFMPFWMRLEL